MSENSMAATNKLRTLLKKARVNAHPAIVIVFRSDEDPRTLDSNYLFESEEVEGSAVLFCNVHILYAL